MRILCLLAIIVALSSFSVSAQEKAVIVSTKQKKSAKPEKAFAIYEKGALMSKATFRKREKSAGNIIEIEALNITGGSILMGREQQVLPPAEITEIIPMVGSYASTRNISSSGRGVVMQLLDVIYPYRARMTVSEQVIEFEIKEPGFWRVDIAVTQ
jgi:hypothetical protein